MAKSSHGFTPLDRMPFNRFQWRSMVTTGMGVFTDGYDLSSVGIVLTLVLASFGVKSLTGWQSSLLAGSALIGAALGALLFGVLGNKGRKTFYGWDVTIMAIGAILQAVVPNVDALIAVRFILGIGIGADYVLSPVIMAEHANAHDRGKTLAAGFGLTWGLGATTAAGLYLLLTAWHVAPDIIWRVVLGFGAVPAISVIALRRKMPETARFLARIEGDADQARAVIHQATGASLSAEWTLHADRRPLAAFWATHGHRIVTAAFLWFLFDIVAYSGILFGPSLIAKGLGLSPGVFQLLMEFGFVVPGALISLLLIDRWGRKPLQILGFLGIAACLVAFGAYQGGATAIPLISLLLYGGQNLMSQAGPGSVSASGMLGVELAPTKIRSIVQGITVASGRVGAALSAFVFPALFHRWGESGAIGFLAAVAALAALVTAVGIPETRQRALEETAQDFDETTKSVDMMQPEL
ncbi:MAG: MFS transporter [Sulfobacillus thermosulfidooxidans]|uniref:MFS transporter n=1 Tax=Sulfobacillus thermosulfidooxidans TaxID=28034 RepID=A0A2T2WTN5_SULTH|nr:MAG: MFS transporter [Sulfobacillus thermosulfidooxidans]